MTVIVAIPHNGMWQVANGAFRMLAEETAQLLANDEDREELMRGQMMGLLDLDELSSGQRQRVAFAMQRAAETLRPALSASDSAWDQSFAEALGDLALRLTELAGTGDA